ncbi:hypothetical protein E5A73_14440 [Sphingomonas gei]|uniref:Uncharacterized protein n=1 Tax=Sphingomonas gei TaxID=1395960 RepID=A0A4S1XDD0_9SPHN|nr:hypothetical protein E5A73_14440 [Sphingomonas gei]
MTFFSDAVFAITITLLIWRRFARSRRCRSSHTVFGI